MTANSTKHERRDWTLIIFLLPIGIVLMLIAGQIAIRLVPSWRVDGGMQSSLDPDTASKNEPGLLQPISFDILTPMGWLDSFLTPGPDSASDGVSFPPFIILEPSLTPSPTISATASGTPSATPTTPTSTPVTPTWTPTDDDDPPPAKCMNPAASNYGGPLPCTYPPAVCNDSGSDNPGGPLPCTYLNCNDSAANNQGDPLPCIYPTSSPLVGSSATVPPGYNEGSPDGTTGGANVANIPDGSYIVITLTAPIVVVGPSDTNYDFVYYERPVAGGGVDMDSVIVSISMDGATYYVVFNWGDGTPDTNSNVGDVAGSENDNQHIDSTELYGTSPQDSGIAVDVDNAPSNPPPGSYSFLAVQAPAAPPSDGNDGADVDAIEVIEVTP